MYYVTVCQKQLVKPGGKSIIFYSYEQVSSDVNLERWL